MLSAERTFWDQLNRMKGWTKSNLRQLCDDVLQQKPQPKKHLQPSPKPYTPPKAPDQEPSPPALRKNSSSKNCNEPKENINNDDGSGNANAGKGPGSDYYGQGAKPKIPKEKESANKKRKLKCEMCNKAFNSEQELSDHVKNHDKHDCELCQNVVFDHVDELWKHVENVHYACNFNDCDFYFGTANGLKYHCQRVHKSDPHFPCKQCGKIYRTRPTMLRHEAKCNAEIVYQNTNSQNEGESGNLANPVNIVPVKTEPDVTPEFGLEDDTGLLLVNCAFCSRELINEQEKDEHEKVCVSNPNRLVVCKLCKVVIHGVVPLKQHLVTKHKQPPYLCKYCHHGFESAKLRDEHVVICPNGPSQNDGASAAKRTRSRTK